MERLLSANADVNIAKSLLAYVVQDKGTLSYELLLRYLTLCVTAGHHSEVFDTYDIMRTCFKTLETGASSLFIKGFSQTERWREALGLLEGLKKALLPSARNYGDAITGQYFMETLRRAGNCMTSFWNRVLNLIRAPGSACFRVASLSVDRRTNSFLLPDQKWSGKFSCVAPRY
ncbi:mitochondrial ribonuclease P catalytic subunit [Pimephales promelas]|nr:mitochondrial ribonuclease P catalytic subunit [Pimephales promelas]